MIIMYTLVLYTLRYTYYYLLVSVLIGYLKNTQLLNSTYIGGSRHLFDHILLYLYD